MKIKILALLFLVALTGSLSAQSFVGKLNQNPARDYKHFTSDDTLKILAVMSDFAEDNDDATFGNGKFESIYSKDYGVTILDPLPHDKTYFENHLKFIQNYYKKVSNGKLNISFTILGEVLTVSKTMRNYSPPLDDVSNLAPLGEYSQEVWELADSKYPNFNFSDYDMFVILHAGVGKDVSLPGSLGNEHDLPSVYLNSKTLKNIFGSDFDGFPMNGGSFKITNSAILPETESRELNGFNGKTLIELTTNGLFAATVGSYLGLPDLFNTETGRSAIGRFGLMDGQSMFKYQGIFPPEPSAWEKIFLGWVTPTTLSVHSKHVNLVNQYVATSSDTTLLKVPINATEYYLIENRKRDANKNGAIVTYVSNGKAYTKIFDRDYENFIYYNVDTLQGVITDVDEFDWALPGGDRNSKIENFEDVGLIIWHIDEGIISEKYESNTINNDRYIRGVAIVEADGIRDIGEVFQTVFGETVIGEGTKEDTWYKGNPSEYYENIFSDVTKPKALANTGANGLITISNFSDVANSASFDVEFGNGNINQLADFDLGMRDKVISFSSVNNGKEVVNYAFYLTNIVKFTTDGIIATFNHRLQNGEKPLLVGYNGEELIVRASGDKLNLFFVKNDTSIPVSFENGGDSFTTSPVLFRKDNNHIIFLIGTLGGWINTYSVDLSSQTISLQNSTKIFEKPVTDISSGNNKYCAIADEYFWTNSFSDFTPFKLDSKGLKIAISKNRSDNTISYLYVVETKNGFQIINDKNEITKINFNKDLLSTEFAITDLKKDGSNYILFNNGKSARAVNLFGAEANNFPFNDEFEAQFFSTPLSADLNSDDAGDVITFTANGKIIAVDGLSGELIDGFPISSGSKVATTPIIFTANGMTAIGVITENNRFLAWNISKYDGKKFWTEANGNPGNSAFVGAPEAEESVAEFFPQAKAYNWPNPVYESSTNIRYYVSEDSKAEVTIFDLSGDLVAKINGNGIGGFDNEIVWDVTNIQSGVYFAHLQVTGNSGKTDSKIIKIAIIK